jgi:hypothetical protein
MSPPPINIDGTEITGATIDGQDVEEITVDGDVVFSAGIPLEFAYATGNDNEADVFIDNTETGDWDFSNPLRAFGNAPNLGGDGFGIYLVPNINDKRGFFFNVYSGNKDIEEFSYTNLDMTSISPISTHNFINGSYGDIGSGIEFSADGKTVFFTLDRAGAGDEVEVWTLSTAFDLSASSRVSNTTVGGFDDGNDHIGPIIFNTDGTRVYHGTRGDNHVAQYDLTTPFDLTTKGSSSRFLPPHVDPMCILFNVDGSELYTYHHSPSMIDKHTLGTPFDITTVQSTTEIVADKIRDDSNCMHSFPMRQF